MTKVGLLSDTHGYWDEKYLQYFESCDEIWHAGDIGSALVADRLAAFRPLRAVCGNCDGGELRYSFPEVLRFKVEQCEVLMKHIGGYPGRYDYRALQLINDHRPDVFICGHSHILKIINDKANNLFCINPGAAGIQGFHAVRTAIRFKVEEGAIKELEVGEWSLGR